MSMILNGASTVMVAIQRKSVTSAVRGEQMEKIYRVQMNSKGMPNFATAEEIADRPQGEWKPKNHHTDYCSNCGFEETQWRTADYNFCPSCGARMKGVDDEHTV